MLYPILNMNWCQSVQYGGVNDKLRGRNIVGAIK